MKNLLFLLFLFPALSFGQAGTPPCAPYCDCSGFSRDLFVYGSLGVYQEFTPMESYCDTFDLFYVNQSNVNYFELTGYRNDIHGGDNAMYFSNVGGQHVIEAFGNYTFNLLDVDLDFNGTYFSGSDPDKKFKFFAADGVEFHCGGDGVLIDEDVSSNTVSGLYSMNAGQIISGYSATSNQYFYANSDMLWGVSSQVLTLNGAIQTRGPSGAAGNGVWNLGTHITGAIVTPSATQYLEVEVDGGGLLKIMLAN